jgi:ribosomal-protein-alanine N-acetyltransferase
MQINPLKPEDSLELSCLHKAAFFKGWEETVFQEFLQNPLIHGLKIEQNHKIIGYLLWQEVETEAEILTLVVASCHQRKGVGNHLFETFFKSLKMKGISDVFLEVAEDNEKALCFYIKKGFTFLSKRPHYYPQKGNKYISALNFFKKLV